LTASYWINVKKQRKLVQKETRDDSRSYKREEQKKKGGRTKQPPFYYVRATMASPARQTMTASSTI